MPLVCTVDVEDWAQSTLDTAMPISDRAGPNMERVLDVLAEENVQATCFVLGKFAEKFPDTVRRIAAEGHEVASHGYGHVDVFQMSPTQFREDIRRSKDQLETLTGVGVKGYRAPDFSIVKESLWALDVLAEEGFIYDASINPAVLARFGVPGFPSQPVRMPVSGGLTLVELPVATLRVMGRHLPVAGGGYHRLLPYSLIRWVIERTVLAEEVFMAYCHPYEFDPDEFKHLKFPLPLKTRLHQGLGRRGFENKFRQMLRQFETTLAATVAEKALDAAPSFSELLKS
ncbi:MAG: polysaccharide deacetylase family protein [Kiritimatiellae bacterium]|nr:polysaccharide deacetylase family protein [Kiritimatiellia bacterium]MDD4340769.1 polysaccharide deacetylase family protein [Kiritimatiellia bacterium]